MAGDQDLSDGDLPIEVSAESPRPDALRELGLAPVLDIESAIAGGGVVTPPGRAPPSSLQS